MIRCIVLGVFLVACFSSGVGVYTLFRCRSGHMHTHGLQDKKEPTPPCVTHGEEEKGPSNAAPLGAETLESLLVQAFFTGERVQGSFPLLEWIGLYKQKHFSQALEMLDLWKKKLEITPVEKNKLSSDAIEGIAAHCLIETGEFCRGREKLHRLIGRLLKEENPWNTEVYNHVVLLLSRSYFLELRCSQSPEIYPDYYETILFYGKKISPSAQYAYEYFLPQEEFIHMLMEHVFDEADRLPLLELFAHLNGMYMEPNYDVVVRCLLETFFLKQSQVYDLCCSLSSLEPLQKRVLHEFSSVYFEKIKQGELTQAKQIFVLLQKLDPERWMKITPCLDSVQEILSSDDEEYTHLKHYLTLWQSEQDVRIDKEGVIEYVLDEARRLWLEGEDRRSLHLFRMILWFTHYDEEKKNTIHAFIKNQHAILLSKQSITRLIEIEDFIIETGMDSIAIPEEALANFIADAEFLYSQGKYTTCYYHSLWLTKVAPSSKTYRLLGLCLVERKCYAEAWRYLHLIPDQERMLDAALQKACTLCQKNMLE